MALLDDKFIVLGVTGGISAYRSCELARLLVKDGAEVQAVMTDAATEFVGPLTLQALTGRPAEVGRGGRLAASGMEHIDLGRQADLVIVAPATANTLAKIACGMADNLLTALVLSSTCPLVLAPAMNTRMWDNRLTRANLATLKKTGRAVFVGPASGSLACGEEGTGRMEEPERIVEVARMVLAPKDLAGRKVLVTAGPTVEPIDPVRVLTNRSSGKMGYALAKAASRRGARVVLVSGPSSLEPPAGAELIEVQTAAQMGRAVEKHLAGSQAVFMVAAVADFTPKKRARSKLKKTDGVPQIELKRTRDILTGLGRKKGRRILVGFAAETSHPVAAARKKLEAKKLDLVVANDVSRPGAGFETDTNIVHLVDKRGADELPLASKEELAEIILDRVAAMLPATRGKKRT